MRVTQPCIKFKLQCTVNMKCSALPYLSSHPLNQNGITNKTDGTGSDRTDREHSTCSLIGFTRSKSGVEWGQEACERMEPVVLPSDDDGQHHHGLRCSVLLQEIWKLKSFLASSQIAKY